jgi:hypothetical protein
MKDHADIWRQRLWVWLPALLFFLANATAFSIYRFGYAGTVQSLDASIEEARQQTQPVLDRRAKLERLIQQAHLTDAQIHQLYDERFSTRSQRLTNITSEVKALARKAGLNPRSFSYPQQEIEGYGLIKRSFIFSVEGTYGELRQFINLLETSDSFLTLEAVTLSEDQSEDGGPELRISLTLSTLFAKESGSIVDTTPRRAS